MPKSASLKSKPQKWKKEEAKWRGIQDQVH